MEVVGKGRILASGVDDVEFAENDGLGPASDWHTKETESGREASGFGREQAREGFFPEMGRGWVRWEK